jgi:cyanophycin synthetase
MEITGLKKMRGPNTWSAAHHKLIVVKADLKSTEHYTSEELNKVFFELRQLLPGLFTRQNGVEPLVYSSGLHDFWLAKAITYAAAELQILAGSYCSHCEVINTIESGVYHLVFGYESEEAGVEAAYSAFRLFRNLLKGHSCTLEEDTERIRELVKHSATGPSTEAIIKAATERNIPFRRLDDSCFITFGYGSRQKRIQASLADCTGSIAVDVASDKSLTKRLLEKARIPVPSGTTVSDPGSLRDAIQAIGFPLVVKPLDGNQGRAVTTGIMTPEDAEKAFALAREISREVIVEKHITGKDFRFLVIDYKLVAVAERTPACVTGDGVHTIGELIDRVNSDPRRGEGHDKILTRITLDEVTLHILGNKGLSTASVLPAGETLYLKKAANLSTGGTAEDVTDLVHPENVFLAERAARIIGLDICGIDIMACDITQPLNGSNGAILEVNAAPGLRMHTHPCSGQPRDAGSAIINMMFPAGDNGRIPLIAVTGTNGKTTTTRLIAHIAATAGLKTGYTTSDGIYIAGRLIEKGDCTGSLSAETVLGDPVVEFAVLECARGGILRHGLGFDQCDTAVVTNVADDHLGLEEIHTIEDMAKVKAVVPQAVKKDGYSILNADDNPCCSISRNLRSKVALFSLDPENPLLLKHCSKGGLAATVQEGCVVLLDGNHVIKVQELTGIPLTLDGTVPFMIQNVLGAVLAAYVNNFSIPVIQHALSSFHPSPEHTPGRMNLFRFRDYDVLVDYAHNTHGMKSLHEYLKNVSRRKVGIVAATGDRRDEDIVNVGRLSALMFDEIIIRQDKDLRGRTAEEIQALLIRGIEESGGKPFIVIPDEAEAVSYAMERAEKETLITVCSDSVAETIGFLSRHKEKEPVGQYIDK